MELKTLSTSSFCGIVPTYYGNDNKYYWFDDDKGALIEVRISNIEVCFKTGQIIYTLMHRGERIDTIAKKDFESPFALTLYKSELAFTDGVAYTQSDHIFEAHCIVRALGEVVNMNYCNGNFNIFAYVMENGKPVKIDVLDKIEGVTIAFVNEGCRTERSCTVNFVQDNEIDIDHTYSSMEELMSYEKVLVVEDSGDKHYTDAKLASLVLTDEQKELVNNFVRAKKALNNAGVIICYNNEDDTTSAINRIGYNRYASAYQESDINAPNKNGNLTAVDYIHGSMAIDYGFDVYLNGENRLYLWNDNN